MLDWRVLRHQGPMQPDEQSPAAMFAEAVLPCATHKRPEAKRHLLMMSLFIAVVSILSFLSGCGCQFTPFLINVKVRAQWMRVLAVGLTGAASG